MSSAAVIPATVEFVDIAGLVRGASQGEGLGNQFLAHIRETDAVVQVVRCFEDTTVASVTSGDDPSRDRELVETELALADLELVEVHLERLARKARSGDREAKEAIKVVDRIRQRLEKGEPARKEALTDEEEKQLRGLNLVTIKPQMYVANVSEDFWSEPPARYEPLLDSLRLEDPSAVLLPVSALLEAELADLPPAERAEYLGGGRCGGIRVGSSHPCGLRAPRTHHLLLVQRERASRVDDSRGRPRAAGCRNRAHRLPGSFYTRGDDRLRRVRALRLAQGGSRGPAPCVSRARNMRSGMGTSSGSARVRDRKETPGALRP